MPKSTAYYALPGHDLGALLVIEDGFVPILFLFGSGFDGRDFRLMATAKPNQDGYDVRKVNSAMAPGDFPAPAQDVSEPIGECKILGRTDGALTLGYAINRKALGYPDVDFSPPPENVTGAPILMRLA